MCTARRFDGGNAITRRSDGLSTIRSCRGHRRNISRTAFEYPLHEMLLNRKCYATLTSRATAAILAMAAL